jgi:CxxC-x17-CxxC domain-containing protein
MNFVDKTLTCRDCGTSFLFSPGEQEFFAQHGFTYPPSRCPECRARRRREQRDAEASSGEGGYGGQRELFSATCASCGQEARVPFEPHSDRLVYCAECFRSQRGAATGGSSRRESRW